MEFEGQYLTKKEYTDLGGSQIEETPFNILEFEARRRIDIRTQNRLKGTETTDVPQEVKLCEFNIIENIRAFNTSKKEAQLSGNITSVSTDGYSESYLNATQIKDLFNSNEDEIKKIIYTYLVEVEFNDKYLIFDGRDNVNK